MSQNDVVIVSGARAYGWPPIGPTGSRIMVSLMHPLAQYGKSKGIAALCIAALCIAALCIGGSETTAVAIKLV